MALNVSLTLGAPAALPTLEVHRYEIRDGLSDLFEVVVFLGSTDPAADLTTVVGQTATLSFADEPLLPQMSGIVESLVQRSSVFSGNTSPVVAFYEMRIVPALWLATRRRNSRIFEELDAFAILSAVLLPYTSVAPPVVLAATPPTRSYRVQFEETDWDFIRRILAEEGITTWFDHARGSVLTLADDTTSSQATALPATIPFGATSNLNVGAPHVSDTVVAARLETARVVLRDYDYQNPPLALEASQTMAGAPLPGESLLTEYSYEAGRFRSTAVGAVHAGHELDALRVPARTFTCLASFALGPGSTMSLTGHPRPEPGRGLLVVRAETVVDDGTVVLGSPGPALNTHTLECIEQSVPFRPLRRERPRVHGTQTAVVVGAGAAGTVDVDAMGRALLEFRWSRPGGPATASRRRVRLSQGWAGSAYGFVTLPRLGDEVVVAYSDGDLDLPLVVGRVHNTTVPTPLQLGPGAPDGTLALWRSQSFSPSGPATGFNEVLMDDLAGKERLELRGQRDVKITALRNVDTFAGGTQTHHTVGDSSTTIDGDWDLTANNVHISTKLYKLNATNIVEDATASRSVRAPQTSETSDKHTIHASGHLELASDGVSELWGSGAKLVLGGGCATLMASSITLQAGGSSIMLSSAGIKIHGAGPVTITGPLITLN